MHRFFFTLYFVLMLWSGWAQPIQTACNCSPLVEEAIHKVTTIYAGFDDKITPTTRRQYNQLINRLRLQATKVKTERACYEVLREYTDFFKDSHVGIWFSTHSSPTQIRRVELATLPTNLPAQVTGLEGIWETTDHKQRVTICKDPLSINQFIAVTLASSDSAWVPGMVKAEIYGYNQRAKTYQGLFYQSNFNGVLDGFSVSTNRIDHWFGPSWYRQGKGEQSLKPQPTVEFNVLNRNFVYLRLARFNQPDVNRLDSLLKANRTLISQSRNLIFDLRGNGGGDASSSEEMIRLIYTNPIVYPSWQYRSSPELIKSTEDNIASLKTQGSTSEWLLTRQMALLGRLRQHPGQLVGGGEDLSRRVDSTSLFPQRIAFLLDGNCGSSTEFFTFEGKQSKKVTTFGTNTYGVMDYGEDHNFTLSCSQYVLSIPWGRNGWIERFGYRIDNVGFSPDVKIPATEPDWVGFVMKYWNK